MKISKEVKTGLLILSAIVLLIFGYNFLKGKNLLSSEKVFYALYNNVEGLDTSSKVTINGFAVGHVTDINFIDVEGKLKVTFNVENDFEFGKNSVAKIYSAGFIGGKNLAIIPEKNPEAMAEDKDILPSIIEPGLVGEVVSKLDPLQGKLQVVLDETAVMLAAVNTVLNEENKTNISNSLKSLSNSLSTIERASSRVSNLLAKNESALSTTITNFKESSDRINKFSTQISEVKVKEMIDNLSKTIKEFKVVASKVNTGKGTAGKLINDPAVYDNLNRATRQLDLLLQDLKLNPKRYVHFSVFGKRGSEYKQPKDSLK